MNITKKKKLKPKTIFTKVSKVLVYLSLSIILILIAILIYLYLNKEDISRHLLNKINTSQNGEVIVDNISLAPFEQFPNFSLNLVGVSYYENSNPIRKSDEEPFCQLNNIFLSFDIFDLINGDINVSRITLKEGYLKFITYEDSTINVSNAFSSKVDSANFIKNDDLKAEDTESFLSIDDLTIKDVTIELDNNVYNRKSSMLVKHSKASFNRKGNKNNVRLASDLNLNYFKLNNRAILNNNLLHISTVFTYDAGNKLIMINSSNIGFDGATFDFEGSFDIKNDGNIDIEISGADKNFSILSLFMNDKFIRANRKMLKKGNYYFDGVIKGKTFNEFPFVELSFGAENVSLDLAKVGKSINDLNFDAYFTTGLKKDFSEAFIKLNNFRTQLPKGNTTGSLSIENFINPYIKFNWYLKTDLAGFEDVLKINAIDDLGGIITVDTDVEGVLDIDEGRIKGNKKDVRINFEKVSIKFPDLFSLNNINGDIKTEKDNFKLDSLNVSIEETDVLLHGNINNILALLLNMESEITADLRLVSDKFDLPKVFSFDPSIGRSFNHILNNLNLNVNAKSTTSRLLNFNSFPAIDFHIDSMSTEFDDFPDIKLVNTNLSIYDDTTGFNIKFNPLNVYGANGYAVLNGAYNGSAWKPYYLESGAKLDNLDLLDLLNQFELDLDSTSFFNKIINGSLDFRLEFPKDSLDFKLVRMKDADLTIYDLAKDDTLVAESLSVYFSDVFYNLNVDSNPMATLTTSGNIEGNRLKASSMDIANFKYDIKVKKGLYKIIPKSRGLFGSFGTGVFIAQPWAKTPSYHLEYTVNNFNIEDLLGSFLEDSVLTGKMNLNMNLEMIGNNWDSIKSKFSGDINIEGNDLLLYGIDTDEVLKRIERSQNFTLVDVGAVLLTGPVGLAVTKGTDMAILLASGVGDVTEIPMFVSNYKINNGIIELDDVAFSTKKNRVAAKGRVSLTNEMMSITFGVLKKDGSLRLSQTVTGRFDEPRMGKIKVISSVLSPVTNLWNSVFQIEGDIFYDGAVKHPE